MTVWARVYFYCIIGVIASMGFLASPGRPWLQKQLAVRNGTRPGMSRTASTESIRAGTTLGLPDDPEREVEEIVAEVRKEIETRRQRGMSVDLDVRKLVEEKMKDLQGLRERKAKPAAGVDGKTS